MLVAGFSLCYVWAFVYGMCGAQSVLCVGFSVLCAAFTLCYVRAVACAMYGLQAVLCRGSSLCCVRALVCAMWVLESLSLSLEGVAGPCGVAWSSGFLSGEGIH